MSRVPAAARQPYGYCTSQIPTFYYEDAEGYVGDYSESDGISEYGQQPTVRMIPHNPDVTELYQRKNNGPSPCDLCQPNIYMPCECCYETPLPQQVAAVSPHRLAATPRNNHVIRKRIVVQPAHHYYNDQVSYVQQTPMYRQNVPHVTHQMLQQTNSSPIPRQQLVHNPQKQQPQPAQVLKRHPVTVRTPRYVRRPTTSLYKRPSALCLPIACQPDPAVHRKHRKVVGADGNSLIEQPCTTRPITRRHSLSSTLPKTKKIDSKRSIDTSETNFDATLERLESVFNKTMKLNSGDQNIFKHLKPRPPPCLKEKQNEKGNLERKSDVPLSSSKSDNINTIISKSQIPEIMKTAKKFEVEEITYDVLDELLNELNESGLNNIINEDDKKIILEAHREKGNSASKISDPNLETKKEEFSTEKDTTTHLELPVKDIPKSFNYEEIKKRKFASNNYISESEESTSQRTESTKNSKIKSKCGSTSDSKSKFIPRTPAIDAMELLRTKSYVVNLIDTALSNHFGTNLCEKNSTHKEYLDARKAVEMLKRHSSANMDKDLCIEIAQVLTDSFASTNASPQSTRYEKISQCSCKGSSDEPTFVKQLKQMRWGHLKHIQREVRRLEDLERFLDSCSVSTFEK